MKTTAADSSKTAPAAKPLRYDPKPRGSWKKVVGSMKDCEHFDAAMRAGAEWRERMNREGK